MCDVSVPGSCRLCDDARVLVLWQAERCPRSHRVRIRLTEPRVDRHGRTILLEPDDRDAMEAATGGRSIPTLVDGGSVIRGVDAILAHGLGREG